MRNGVLASKIMQLRERDHTLEEKQAMGYMDSALQCMAKKESALALEYLRRAKSYLLANTEPTKIEVQDADPYIKTRLSLSYLKDGLYSNALESLCMAEIPLVRDVAENMKLPPLVW